MFLEKKHHCRQIWQIFKNSYQLCSNNAGRQRAQKTKWELQRKTPKCWFISSRSERIYCMGIMPGIHRWTPVGEGERKTGRRKITISTLALFDTWYPLCLNPYKTKHHVVYYLLGLTHKLFSMWLSISKNTFRLLFIVDLKVEALSDQGPVIKMLVMVIHSEQEHQRIMICVDPYGFNTWLKINLKML